MKTTALFLLCMLCLACKKDFSNYYSYNPPEILNDGINVGTLEEVGLDSTMLAKAIGNIWANKYDQIHSFLIYKDGKLVFEEYFEGNRYKYDGRYHYGERIQWHRDSLHVIHSCTKSITSALIGIAVEKGHIENVRQSIFDYLPDHQKYKNGGREDITIEHLLTMTSGLKWNEWVAHGSAANDIDRLYWECDSDPLACVLERPLVAKPGEEFTYNSGGTVILGEILRNATGKNIKDFSVEHLFKPLGIDSVFWRQFGSEVYSAEGGVRITPRDMLKFGITFLNDGSYNGQRIISDQGVHKSREDYRNNKSIRVPINDFGRMGYSYSWWTDELKGGIEIYAAAGWGGQKIIVIDQTGMVVVFTGGNYVIKSHYRKILERFVLPSIDQ